ncbi:MAG: hypothetical protein R3B06_12095 [Kofleriaceae bacterium]
MSTADDLRGAVTRAILTGVSGTAAVDRQAAYDGSGPAGSAAYLDQVRFAAAGISDDDVGALRAAGLDDDGIFELTVAAAVGHADRQRAAAEAALTEALAASGGA